MSVQGPVKEQQPDGMSHRGAMDPQCLDHHNPPPMVKQKWWGQDSGVADLQEKIDTASCGEEYTGDCPGARKETTDGL